MASYWDLPIEIRVKIAENLESYHDVENLCLVDKALSVHIEDRFRRRKTAQVLDILLENNYLGPSSGLECRLVSKLWKESVDRHYRTANIHSISFKGGNSYRYAAANIVFPVAENFVETLKEYSEHGQNPFVGNRLLLRGANRRTVPLPKDEAISMITSAKFENVWKYVEHLEIKECLPFRRLDRVALQPFLVKMENVKSVVFEVATGTLDVLDNLPNLCRLEQLVFTEKDPVVPPNKWRILETCASSLKLLCNNSRHGIGMDYLLQSLTFTKLEELNLKNTDIFVDVLGPSLDLSIRFPNLKAIYLAISYEDNQLYRWLVQLSNAVKTLEHVQLLCRMRLYSNGPHIDETDRRMQVDRSDLKVTVRDAGFTPETTRMIQRLKRVFADVRLFEVSTSRHLGQGDNSWWYSNDQGNEYRY